MGIFCGCLIIIPDINRMKAAVIRDHCLPISGLDKFSDIFTVSGKRVPPLDTIKHTKYSHISCSRIGFPAHTEDKALNYSFPFFRQFAVIQKTIKFASVG